MAGQWGLSKTTLPAGEWTAIICPWNCNYFSIKSVSGNALGVGSSAIDTTQQDTLPANAQEVVGSPYGPPFLDMPVPVRFIAGQVLLYAYSAGGDVCVLRTLL
jgi:hypothetical protein